MSRKSRTSTTHRLQFEDPVKSFPQSPSLLLPVAEQSRGKETRNGPIWAAHLTNKLMTVISVLAHFEHIDSQAPYEGLCLDYLVSSSQ